MKDLELSGEHQTGELFDHEVVQSVRGGVPSLNGREGNTTETQRTRSLA
ncbi:MAG: hypothetical protein M1343_00605 [Chloroflexi bacterium]|nr:hypothetical protein [Chloroflexota bacterium]